MVTRAIEGPMYVRESVERKPWTSEDLRDLVVFLAQSFGIVCAGVVVYFLGPALGMALIVGGLAVWSLFGNWRAPVTEEDGPAKPAAHHAQ